MNAFKKYNIAMFEDGATDRAGDVREAFPSGDRKIISYTLDLMTLVLTHYVTISSSALQH